MERPIMPPKKTTFNVTGRNNGPAWSFDKDADEDRKRGGTMMRDSSGHAVPGEFNALTGKPLGANDRFGKGLTPQAEWDEMFKRKPVPNPMMTGTKRQDGPSNIVLPDTRKPGPGYSADEVSKFVQANPTGPASFMTPWGPIARGGAPMPAAPVAPKAIASSQITPASPAVNPGPAIGKPAASPLPSPGNQPPSGPSGGSTPLWSRAGQALTQANKVLTGNESIAANYTARGAGRALKTARENVGKVRKAITPTLRGTGEAIAKGAKSAFTGMRDFAEEAGLPVPIWAKSKRPMDQQNAY